MLVPLDVLTNRARVIAVALVTSVASPHGQSPVDPATARDLVSVCKTYGVSRLVFVGRAEAPVTYHISGEPRMEEARKELDRIKAEVAEEWASSEPLTMERVKELLIRIHLAQEEFDHRRVMYPPPYDLTFIPVRVERALRGVTEPVLMLWPSKPALALAPGEPYLINGVRSSTYIPHFWDMPDFVDFAEYVQTMSATPVALAQRDLRVLASTASGATILGSLQMLSTHEGPAGGPLSGIRMFVSSGSHVVETTTRTDGSFTVSGIESGHLAIKPMLRDDLTVVNRSSLELDMPEGGCTTVNLSVAVNGRLRGRIISATGQPVDGTELTLRRLDSNGRLDWAHAGSTTTVRPDKDGAYEFFGQAPGSYALSAVRVRIESGNERRLVTFYPGTPDADGAVPIVIGRAAQLDGFDFLVVTE